MKKDLDTILELRDPDTDFDEVSLEPSLKKRVILMGFTLVLLGVTYAPVGIMTVLRMVGIHAGAGYYSVNGFLLISTFIGLVSIGASNPKVFRFVFWVLFGLALLNLGGLSTF